MGIAAGVSAAAGAVSAGAQLAGAGKASGGSQQSQYLQALEMNQNIANTAPFIGAGQYATNALQAGLQSGQYGTPMDLSGMPTAAQAPTAPGPFVWNPTMEGLAQTPGYQFTLDQGLKAVQSSAAARGLGMSGAAMRGAADYASGKASETYNQQLTNALNINTQGLNIYGKQLAGYQAQGAQFQNQFSDYWDNQKNPFSQYYDLARLGANSAAQQATSGTTAASNIGAAAQAQGQYQGGGIAQAGNALAGTLNSPGVQQAIQSWGSNAYGYGNSAPGTPGVSASGNPVMTGFASPTTATPLPGGGYSWS
jgi:hypothetical protein